MTLAVLLILSHLRYNDLNKYSRIRVLVFLCDCRNALSLLKLILFAMADIKPYAFTGRYTMYRNRIVSDVWLCSPEEGNTNATKIRALWDTGCSHSIISKRVADFLSLPTVGVNKFRSPFGGVRMCEMTRVKVCVVLGAERLTIDVGVDDRPNSDLDCDITLGLDFITQGDFAITHDDGQLVLSFCYPPIGTATDYAVIVPKLSAGLVNTEVCVINEENAVEYNRRKLIMLDYYKEAHSNK